MEKTIAFIRQNLLACAIAAGVLCCYGYLTLAGKECFNCEQTQSYKSDARHGSGLRFRHK